MDSHRYCACRHIPVVFFGIKLPGLHYNNQRVEARFRKRLVYAEDDKRFADMPSVLELFTGLRFNYFRLYLHSSYFRLCRGFLFAVCNYY